MRLPSTLSVAILLALWSHPAVTAAPADELKQLLEEAWQHDLREDPLLATQAGDRRFNDRLPNVTIADIERRAAADRKFLERLEAIDRSQLDRENQINYDVFRRLRADGLREYELRGYLMPITNREGFHIFFADLPKQTPLDTVQDYENYLSRLNAFRVYTDQHIELLREAVKQGYTLPAVVLRGFEKPIQSQITDDPTRSVLFDPFKKFPDRVPDADRVRLTESARQAIAENVVPAYRDFLEFMSEDYVPQARTQPGASALPNGREFYRHRVRQYTTLDLTPEAVHETGLAEVKRIRGEMEELIREIGFDGDFAKFVEHLRTDPAFYATTPEQLLKETSLVLKRMDGELPRLFKRLPRVPYGIREVPDYIAPITTTAYYMPSSGDGSRAGFYYVNTYDLKSRPLYEIEALSLHEAVPGHHLQIALQQELSELPPFRRFAGFTAFVEGWGLYSERLGLEVGFYEDPYQNFGRLSYEMWRACRLVVDTGIHYLGWTREQAIQFMADNSAMTLLNITNEVDRYIAWPGQALAYKTGELKIRQLRAEAEEKLGVNFDIREFHDVVLRSGAVPLDVLEANVRSYIETASSEH
ncbi:MAG: DUF885 domain-containing protein [Planctomycetia bacterium]|nr:DUF885 domain-containing protein [Planctomycetia bacterium]